MGSTLDYLVKKRVRINHLFVLALLLGARTINESLLVGAILIALGALIRVLAAGVIEKDQRLACSGIYAHVRNPLYLGSLLLGLGFTIMAANPVLALAFPVIFIPLYARTIAGEEAFLEGRFGDEFRAYKAATPRLIPRLKPYPGRSGTAGFSLRQAVLNREFGGLVGALVVSTLMGVVNFCAADAPLLLLVRWIVN